MLVAYPVFIEQLGHFFGDHVVIVRDGNQRDFFSSFFHIFRSRLVCRRLFWLIVHAESIHYSGDEKGTYSKASREERSGYVFWHAVHVRK